MSIFGLKYKLETPYEGKTISGNRLLVGGWAFLDDGRDIDIKVLLNGQFVTLCKWGLVRYDVFKIYQTEDSYESGFFFNIFIKDLEEGSHKITVVASVGSEEETIGETTFLKVPSKNDIKHENKEYKFSYLEGAFIPAGAGSGSIRKSWGFNFEGFINLAKPAKNADILDIGCGMGRFTLPFLRYLDSSGSYTGLELLETAVRFQKENFEPKYNNFEIQRAEVFNDLYNKEAKQSASSYTFPFDDGSFDFVFLQSVFTHLVKEDLENYLKEIARVMKKGGKCLITYFILDSHARKQIETGKPNMTFKFKQNGFWSNTEQKIEIATAYDSEDLEKLYKSVGLKIEKINLGAWRCDKSIKSISSQDIIVAVNE